VHGFRKGFVLWFMKINTIALVKEAWVHYTKDNVIGYGTKCDI
jgi:hypothetical protein